MKLYRFFFYSLILTISINLCSRQLFNDSLKYRFLFESEVTYWTTDNKPEKYSSKEEALSQMTTISVPVWRIGKEGNKYSSSASVTVNRLLKNDVEEIFNEIYRLAEQFPVDTLTGFRWNTNGEVSGPLLDNVTCMSAHAYGAAVDINYYQNDYYVGAGNDLRDVTDPYYITENVIDIFEKHGWYWGGDYAICSDTMHFQYTGLEMLSYNNGSPFKKYSCDTENVYSVQVKNIQRRLNHIGYECGCDGIFGVKTEEAVRAFQRDNGLVSDGITHEDFYILLYNLTNEMYDVK